LGGVARKGIVMGMGEAKKAPQGKKTSLGVEE